MNTTFENLSALLNEHSDLADLGLPASAEMIAGAESTLGLAFDPVFSRYLATWGVLAFGPLEFYGITANDPRKQSIPNAVWFTLTKRKQLGLPLNLVAIFDNDGDEFYCVDCADNGRIVIWDVATSEILGAKAINIVELIIAEAKGFIG